MSVSRKKYLTCRIAYIVERISKNSSASAEEPSFIFFKVSRISRIPPKGGAVIAKIFTASVVRERFSFTVSKSSSGSILSASSFPKLLVAQFLSLSRILSNSKIFRESLKSNFIFIIPQNTAVKFYKKFLRAKLCDS